MGGTGCQWCGRGSEGRWIGGGRRWTGGPSSKTTCRLKGEGEGEGEGQEEGQEEGQKEGLGKVIYIGKVASRKKLKSCLFLFLNVTCQEQQS